MALEIPARYVVSGLMFLGLMNLYATRVQMSVAIVAMVRSSNDPYQEPIDGVCPSPNATTSLERNTTDFHGEFTWDSRTQGLILGSFFYGYLVTQMPGAWLGRRFGPKHVYGMSIFISGLMSLFIPLMARYHYGLLIANRVLQGFFQGVCYPNTHALLGKWSPPAERSRMSTLVYCGNQVGIVIALLASGVLAEYIGWESIFYVFGTTSILWYILWVLFAYDSPEEHPRISPQEKKYILASIGDPIHSDRTVPWKEIFTSVPVWALSVGTFGNNWGFYCLLTTVPTYLSNVLHFKLKSNGFSASIPYIAMGIMIPVSGLIADWLRNRRVLSTTNVRKLFQCLGVSLTAACLVGVGHAGCDVTAAMSLLTLGGAVAALACAGFQVNHIDIAPAYAGILMGLTNTIGTVPGILAPYVVGVLVPDQSVPQWQMVFYIAAVVYLISAVFYAVFASGELAVWGKPKARVMTTEL